jgi:hypothetical protein
MKLCLDCGKEKSDKGKYCKNCGYKHRIRPKGIKYNLSKENPTSFKKGQIPWNKNKKGLMPIPWNKGTKGLCKLNKTSFTSAATKGESNCNWKRDDVGYHALHAYMKRNYVWPDCCEHCGSNKNIQLASKNYKYSRNKSDWIILCAKCHRKYDVKNGWGLASKKYHEIKKRTDI